MYSHGAWYLHRYRYVYSTSTSTGIWNMGVTPRSWMTADQYVLYVRVPCVQYYIRQHINIRINIIK